MMKRAYSTFTVKSVNEDQRVIEGIATTPTPDHMGDIVEPDGAEFSLPIPLLWQHDASQPIGHVTRAKIGKEGIVVTAKLVKMTEPGALKDRLDEAWQSVKSGLVRGLSIGFLPVEQSQIKETFGFRFLKWKWLELSAVTIPANMEASISTIKSMDLVSLSAASRAEKAGQEPGSGKSPGAAGKTATVKLRSKAMPTIRETISSYEAKRAANVAAMEKIMNDASDKGESLDEEQQKEFDALNAEVEQVDAHIARLKVTERLNAQKAQPIDDRAGTDPEAGSKSRVPYGSVRVESKLAPGVKFARMAMSIARAKAMGLGLTPEQCYRQEKRWMDTGPEVALALKAAVDAGDTTTATWASELAYAQNIASEFIEFLRPMTIVGRISGWRNVPFNVRVASQTTGSTGYWVGQGKPIPMSAQATSSVSLGIAKVAGMSAIDKELARLSTPSAELMVRNDLARELQKTLDLSLIDPNQGGQTNIQPASLTYGVTPVTPSGTNYAAFVTDWKSLTSTMIAANLPIAPCVVLMDETTAQALSMMVTSLGNPQFPGLSITGGTLNGLPVIVSNQLNISGSPQFSNMIVLLNPGEVFLADDGAATLEASDQVAIQMLDNPTNQSTATATATTMVSMFQTESVAIKAVRYINWTKARTQACAFIQAAAYA